LEAKKSEEKQFQQEIEKAEGNLSGKIKDWDNTSKFSKFAVWISFFFAMSLQKNRLNMPGKC
jgi:hypothetical protein